MSQLMALHDDFNISILNMFKEIDITERFWKEMAFKCKSGYWKKEKLTEVKNVMERFHTRLQTPEGIINKMEEVCEVQKVKMMENRQNDMNTSGL